MSYEATSSMDPDARESKRPRLESDSASNGATTAAPLAGATAEVQVDATVGEAQIETRELVPEVFITLHASWGGKSHEVVLGESDRYVC